MPDHEMREDCKEFKAETKDFEKRMEKQPDGVIPCIQKKLSGKADGRENRDSHQFIHTRIDGRVGLRIFLSLIGVLVMIVGGSLTYTYS